jgi:hypothetical protein
VTSHGEPALHTGTSPWEVPVSHVHLVNGTTTVIRRGAGDAWGATVAKPHDGKRVAPVMSGPGGGVSGLATAEIDRLGPSLGRAAARR